MAEKLWNDGDLENSLRRVFVDRRAEEIDLNLCDYWERPLSQNEYLVAGVEYGVSNDLLCKKKDSPRTYVLTEKGKKKFRL